MASMAWCAPARSQSCKTDCYNNNCPEVCSVPLGDKVCCWGPLEAGGTCTTFEVVGSMTFRFSTSYTQVFTPVICPFPDNPDPGGCDDPPISCTEVRTMSFTFGGIPSASLPRFPHTITPSSPNAGDPGFACLTFSDVDGITETFEAEFPLIECPPFDEAAPSCVIRAQAIIDDSTDEFDGVYAVDIVGGWSIGTCNDTKSRTEIWEADPNDICSDPTIIMGVTSYAYSGSCFRVRSSLSIDRELVGCAAKDCWCKYDFHIVTSTSSEIDVSVVPGCLECCEGDLVVDEELEPLDEGDNAEAGEGNGCGNCGEKGSSEPKPGAHAGQGSGDTRRTGRQSGPSKDETRSYPAGTESGGNPCDEYPVSLAYGHKVESVDDLYIPVTGYDFVITREYSSRPLSTGVAGYGLVGANWSLSCFQFLKPDGSDLWLAGSTYEKVRFDNQGGSPVKYTPSGPMTRYIEQASLAIGGNTYNTWKMVEPGEWETHFYRPGTGVPATLEGQLLQWRDLYGNKRTYEYEFYGPTGNQQPRLRRILLNGARTASGLFDADVDAVVEFEWILDNSTSHGRLSRISVRRLGSEGIAVDTDFDPLTPPEFYRLEYATEYVNYLYYKDGVSGQSVELGTPGDLIEVQHRTVVDRMDLSSVESATLPYHTRITQYRYHTPNPTSSGPPTGSPCDPSERLQARGKVHQLKMVIMPEQMEYYAQQVDEALSTPWPYDTAILHAAERLRGKNDADIETDWPGATDPAVVDLAAKIVSYNSSSDRVEYQYLQTACGCGGGSPQGIKQQYTYLAHEDWRSTITDEFRFVGMIIGDECVEYEETPYRTRIRDMELMGSPPHAVPYLRHSIVREPGGREWVTAYTYNASRQVEEVYTPSSIDSYTPLVPSVNIPSITPESAAGLIHRYTYVNKRPSEVLVRKGSGGPAVAVSKVTYPAANTSNLRTYLPSRIDHYRVAGSGSANDLESTWFEYGFGGSDEVLWRKVFTEAELESENGPASAPEVDPETSTVGCYLSISLFDSRGRTSWQRLADGRVDYVGYNDYHDSVSITVTNADAGGVGGVYPSLPAAHGGLSTSGWGRFGDLDAEDLVTTYGHDAMGRLIEMTSPGGVKSYFQRELRESLERPRMAYYTTITFPHQLVEPGLAHEYDGPASLSMTNAAGKTIQFQQRTLVGNADYSPVTGNYVFEVTSVDHGEVARSTTQHLLSGLVASRREWYDIVGSRSVGDPYYTTSYVYDVLGRTKQVTNANGSVAEYDYDVRDRVIEVKVGTSSSSGLVSVSKQFFDSGGAATQGVGNGNVTLVQTFADGTVSRSTERTYDFRDRPVLTEPPEKPYELIAYDNLNRVIERGMYSAVPTIPSPGASLPNANRGVYSKIAYNQRGLRFRQQVARVPDASSPDFLESHSWFDANGRGIAEWMPSAPGSKRVYDGLGRPKVVYSTDRAGDAAPGTSGNHASATSVTGDIVLEQVEYRYNDDDRVDLVTTRQRLHDADGSVTGALSDSGTRLDSIATYVGYVYDSAQRQSRTVNFGTNDAAATGYPTGIFKNASAPTWPPTPPAPAPDWSSTYADLIVTGTLYGTRGLIETTIDSYPFDNGAYAAGPWLDGSRRTQILYDDLGRRIAVIENYVDAQIAWDSGLDGGRWKVSSGLNIAEPDTDRVTSFVYNGSGNVIRQTAHLPHASNPESVQVTQYAYGTSIASGSLIDSNDLLSEVHYPNETDGSPGTTDAFKVKYRYNRLGELIKVTDQNQTEHTYTRDVLGRITRDGVTAFGLGSSIDDYVKSIGVVYDDLGRLQRISSNKAADGTGDVVNEVEFGYTGLWQVESVIQDPDSALTVLGGTSIPQRSITYAYDTQPIGAGVGGVTGPGNYSRVSRVLYPGGDGYDHNYTVTPWDDRISRLSSLVVPTGGEVNYQFVGQSMFAAVDYVAPDLQLDRTLDAEGRRRLSSHTSQAAGIYPGWDRFGRVIAQAWVDGELQPTSPVSTRPDRPQVVYETHTYDRASNRLSKHDARDEVANGHHWYSQDNRYAYDGLDRLTTAIRGRWTGVAMTFASGGPGGRDSSQKWNLDMLGNWAGDPHAAPAVPGFIRDSNGDGDFDDGPTTDLADIRDHNAANEIKDSSLRGGGSVPFAYDDAGNMQSARQESSAAGRRYVHDAWNRLVRVMHDNATSSTSDDYVIARYGYNGLHWRVLKHADVRTLQQVPASGFDSTNRREAMYFDASWRLVHREIEDGYVPGTSEASPWAPTVAEQLFWGARYIDDAVARRRTTEIAETEPLNATFDEPQWYLTDAQFSVVALMSPSGSDVLERVRYDPYGNAQHISPADFDGTGEESFQDLINFIGYSTSAEFMGDINRSGATNSQDYFDFAPLYFGSYPDTPFGSGWVSHPDTSIGGSDNVVGYCGYVFNHETSDCTVRFRHYSPGLGRWLERDPAGYAADGLLLYGYCKGAPTAFMDPSGLKLVIDVHDGGQAYTTFAGDVHRYLQKLLGDCATVSLVNGKTRKRSKLIWPSSGILFNLGVLFDSRYWQSIEYTASAEIEVQWKGGSGCIARKECFAALQKLIGSTQTTTIHNSKSNSVKMGFRKVFWDPLGQPAVWTDPSGNGDLVWRETDPAITLWHELMHILHGHTDMEGELFRKGYKNPQLSLENIGRACLREGGTSCSDRYTGPRSYLIDDPSEAERDGRKPGDRRSRPEGR